MFAVFCHIGSQSNFTNFIMLFDEFVFYQKSLLFWLQWKGKAAADADGTAWNALANLKWPNLPVSVDK